MSTTTVLRTELEQRIPLLKHIRQEALDLTRTPRANMISTPHGNAVYRDFHVNAVVSAYALESKTVSALLGLRESLFALFGDTLMSLAKTPVITGRLPLKWSSSDCIALFTHETNYQHTIESRGRYAYGQNPLLPSVMWESLEVQTHSYANDIVLDTGRSRVINMDARIKTGYDFYDDCYKASLSVSGFWLIIFDALGNDQPAQWQNALLPSVI